MRILQSLTETYYRLYCKTTSMPQRNETLELTKQKLLIDNEFLKQQLSKTKKENESLKEQIKDLKAKISASE